jgi:hypothetical protein
MEDENLTDENLTDENLTDEQLSKLATELPKNEDYFVLKREKSAWDEIYNTYLKKEPLISKRLSVFFSKYRSELENMPAKE